MQAQSLNSVQAFTEGVPDVKAIKVKTKLIRVKLRETLMLDKSYLNSVQAFTEGVPDVKATKVKT
jgi:hypothetical protein